MIQIIGEDYTLAINSKSIDSIQISNTETGASLSISYGKDTAFFNGPFKKTYSLYCEILRELEERGDVVATFYHEPNGPE